MESNSLGAYEIDSSRIKGRTKDVFHPNNLIELKGIVSNSPRIVVRGGGSGFSGGAVPLNGEDVVIDLSKLDKIENLDMERKTVEVEAGVILEELQDFLKKHNLEFPIDIESRSIATIGGMIATNAFGSRVLKYRRMENWIKWIEVVDSLGTVSRKGATELSDYTGLEGISGIVFRACLKLEPLKKRSASLIKLDNISAVVETTLRLKREVSVSGIDFFDKVSSSLLGFSDNYHIIVEYENETDGLLKREEYFRLMKKKNEVYYHLFSKGYNKVEDLKTMIDRLPKIYSWLEERKIPYFGNISVGVTHPFLNGEQEKFLGDMFKFVKSIGGHMHPKHGVGILKKDFVGSVEKKILENIKKRTDISNKFNVGKVI